MKKFYLPLAIAAASLLSASASSKFDLHSSGLVNYYLQVKENPGEAIKYARFDLPFDLTEMARAGKAETNVIIKLSEGASLDAIEAAGLVITTEISERICIATGDMEDIIALENNDAVETMSLPRLMKPLLDKAREGSGVTDVQQGKTLGTAYTGSGVVCGIFDIGLDPNHINFYDKDFNETRVKAVYKHSSSGQPLAYETLEEIKKFTTDTSSESHGTHTTGIMAGAHMLAGNKSGYPTGKTCLLNSSATGVTNLASTKNPYYGVAYDADLIINCGTSTTDNMLASVKKAIDYAKANNKPLVFNLSFGRNDGSHDGYGSFGDALNELSKDAIICVSSGNEGEDPISIVKTFSAGDTQLKTSLYLGTGSQGFISTYSGNSTPFKLTLAIVDKTTGTVVDSQTYSTAGSYRYNTAKFTEAFTSTSAMYVDISKNETTNNRYGVEMTYSLTNNSNTNSKRNLVLAIIIDGVEGQRVDLVNSLYGGNCTLSSNGMSGYLNGTTDLTINDLSCNKNVISVGSWNSRVVWPASKGVYGYQAASGMVANEVSPFTSYGHLVDGRHLPDICAPGANIISSYNSYDNSSYTQMEDISATFKYNSRDYTWRSMQGTSMASPFCAGVIATWLQADPTLTVARVKEILKASADPLAGNADKIGGGGKLNALKGLQYVLNANGVNDIKVDQNDIMVVGKSANLFEVYVPGGDINVTVYNVSGQPVKSAFTTSTNLDVDLNSLQKGIYIINVNGVKSQRVAVN